MSFFSGLLGLAGGRGTLFLAIPLVFFAGLSTCRGGKIERLNERIGAMSAALTEAEAENGRLAKSLALINDAAKEQAALNYASSQRRDKIDDLALGESTVARPQGVIDDEKSRRVIDLLNADIFAPLGHGMLKGQAAPGPDPLPGSAAAVNVDPEPG